MRRERNDDARPEFPAKADQGKGRKSRATHADRMNGYISRYALKELSFTGQERKMRFKGIAVDAAQNLNQYVFGSADPQGASDE